MLGGRPLEGIIFVLKFSLTPFLKSGRSVRGYEKLALLRINNNNNNVSTAVME
jgi:hypothetical protein